VLLIKGFTTINRAFGLWPISRCNAGATLGREIGHNQTSLKR